MPSRHMGRVVKQFWIASLSGEHAVQKETNLLRSPGRTPHYHTGPLRFPCPQDSSGFLSIEKWT